MKFVIHSNKVSWGHVWHIITSNGVGHVALELDNDDLDTMYLYSLSVYQDSRNKGIGKKLMNEAEKIAIENNVYKIKLDIDKPKKQWLYDFYVHLGYEDYKEDDEYIYFKKYLNY